MARPLSEEKRQRLLNAAAELIATTGTSASTAKIARAAEVSEGTLFVYFPTKDDLLNEVFVAIESDLARTMAAAYPEHQGARDRLSSVWNRLIDWGLANPIQRKALRQLKVSDRISDESRRACESLLGDARSIVEACLADHADPRRVSIFIDVILFGLADTVTDAIVSAPNDHAVLRGSGFDLFWSGSAR